MQPDLADPRWFPADYAADRHALRLALVEIDTIERASFLDRRAPIDWHGLVDIPVDAVTCRAATPPAFLFHTAFCGSTLLARALHLAPDAVSLKEPLVLHAIGNEPTPSRRADALERAICLLSRPWSDRGKVLIKPANQANGLLQAMLRAAPAARAVLLYSALDEFMLSCFKKLPEAERRIRWMAQSLANGTRLADALALDLRTEFNLVESCALAWYAQMERYADALDADADDRLRSLDMRRMLDSPKEVVAASAAWLQLDERDLDTRTHAVFSRDAKRTARAFDSAQRDRERSQVLARYGEVIEQGVSWANRAIAPAARLPTRWKPLLPG